MNPKLILSGWFLLILLLTHDQGRAKPMTNVQVRDPTWFPKRRRGHLWDVECDPGILLVLQSVGDKEGNASLEMWGGRRDLRIAWSTPKTNQRVLGQIKPELSLEAKMT